jgi:formyl-CoA transferase
MQDPDHRGPVVETSLMEAMSTLTIDAFTQAYEIGEDPVRETRHPQAQNF